MEKNASCFLAEGGQQPFRRDCFATAFPQTLPVSPSTARITTAGIRKNAAAAARQAAGRPAHARGPNALRCFHRVLKMKSPDIIITRKLRGGEDEPQSLFSPPLSQRAETGGHLRKGRRERATQRFASPQALRCPYAWLLGK